MGVRPYYALNPLRGGASSFAKASEDMSKGARGGRGEEKFAPQLRDPACAGKFGMRNSKIGEWPCYASNLADSGGASSFAKASEDMSKGFRGVG